MTYAVPNPQVPHVHPYPTRFHGGLWTRPVFEYPWQQSVQSVFKPSDFNDANPGLRGLGELLWQTNRGVFGAERDGGGVFGPLAGLGVADYSPPAFDPTFVVTPTPGSTVPALKDIDPRVTELQGYMNRVLTNAGYRSLGIPDGKLGPATCGAIAWYKATGRQLAAGTTTQAAIDANLAAVGEKYASKCQGLTLKMPTKGTAAPVGPSTPVGPAPVMPQPIEEAGMSPATKYAIGGGVLAVVGFFVAKKAKWI